jgi:hypothetical protein
MEEWWKNIFFKEKFEIFRRSNRVARFYLFQTYQNVANIPNDHTLYQKAKNIPNGFKIFQMVIKYNNIFQSEAL